MHSPPSKLMIITTPPISAQTFFYLFVPISLTPEYKVWFRLPFLLELSSRAFTVEIEKGNPVSVFRDSFPHSRSFCKCPYRRGKVKSLRTLRSRILSVFKGHPLENHIQRFLVSETRVSHLRICGLQPGWGSFRCPDWKLRMNKIAI